MFLVTRVKFLKVETIILFINIAENAQNRRKTVTLKSAKVSFSRKEGRKVGKIAR